MLFDLRARGRRRTVQVVYASLALLLGGGLVLFGIGGDVQGGLWDGIFGDGRQDSGNEQIEQTREDAQERTQQSPRDPAAWAALALAEYQLAGVSEGFNGEDQSQPFKGEARERLVAA